MWRSNGTSVGNRTSIGQLDVGGATGRRWSNWTFARQLDFVGTTRRRRGNGILVSQLDVRRQRDAGEAGALVTEQGVHDERGPVARSRIEFTKVERGGPPTGKLAHHAPNRRTTLSRYYRSVSLQSPQSWQFEVTSHRSHRNHRSRRSRPGHPGYRSHRGSKSPQSPQWTQSPKLPHSPHSRHHDPAHAPAARTKTPERPNAARYSNPRHVVARPHQR